MRFVVIFLGLVFFAAPSVSVAQTAGAPCQISELGSTRMSTNQEDILACLKSGAGYVWKSFVDGGRPVRGTVCGLYIQDGGAVSGPCQGHNPNVSCPPGFIRVRGGTSDPDVVAFCYYP